jgi:outer membrane biosynthesis protein TonB
VEVSPAALGSIGLHGAIALALMISWGSRDLKVGAVVPVTIVSNAPDADTRPAVQAAETQTAMTEEPVPDAPPEPAPPPQAEPEPAPQAKAAKPAEEAPAPAKAKTKPAQRGLDLDALVASLTRPARNQPPRPSSAAKGASRAETAPTARSTVGSGLASGAALQGLAEELQRRWNPNCEVEGGRDVVVTVTFKLGVGGQVVGEPEPKVDSGRSAAAQVGADRAVRAVYQTAPFRNLPREYYGERIAVTFDAKQACAHQ